MSVPGVAATRAVKAQHASPLPQFGRNMCPEPWLAEPARGCADLACFLTELPALAEPLGHRRARAGTESGQFAVEL
jgi:hypothetical protein